MRFILKPHSTSKTGWTDKVAIHKAMHGQPIEPPGAIVPTMMFFGCDGATPLPDNTICDRLGNGETVTVELVPVEEGATP